MASVHFSPRTAELLPRCGDKLVQLVEYVKQHPSTQIALAGHEDQVEMSQLKPNIPQSRVIAVRRALLAAGVESWRFMPPPAPWGDNWGLLCAEDTDTCREKNRRVEIFVKL
jgi:outer membrane protein OmpA-like peptidoglycan-associated protein